MSQARCADKYTATISAACHCMVCMPTDQHPASVCNVSSEPGTHRSVSNNTGGRQQQAMPRSYCHTNGQQRPPPTSD
eukprot:10640431-Lingulodinium_polyedra.AAC.1